MSLSRCRSVARALRNRQLGASALQSQQRWSFSDEGPKSNEGAAYRPWPMDFYSYPDSAKYWSKKYPSVAADKDDYDKEELYLDEIEARMQKYDKRYRNTDEWKKLNNEYGWEDQDDRAFYYYGSGLGAEPGNPDQFGRGQKIDPAHYVHNEVITVQRNPYVSFTIHLCLFSFFFLSFFLSFLLSIDLSYFFFSLFEFADTLAVSFTLSVVSYV